MVQLFLIYLTKSLILYANTLLTIPCCTFLNMKKIYLKKKSKTGFNLWTSAHGFHHLTLTQSKAWRIFWLVILIILGISLISCIIYYFYYVFTFGVYSKFILESPKSITWPTTIICDRQVFRFILTHPNLHRLMQIHFNYPRLSFLL
jgi:hypothetical protein